MSGMAPGSDRASTGSSAYADSGKYASWGRSSDGGSRRGREKEKDDGNHLTVFRRRGRKSGGFLMGNMFQPRDSEDDKTESPSKPSLRKPSRLGQNVATPANNLDGAPPMPQASLDPTQLVQMALSLSEGRRRHVSANLQVPATANDKRRVRSSGAPVIHVSPGSPMGNDFMRPTSLDDSGYRASTEDEASFMSGQEVDYDFSQATLHRAERARKFFELSSEYRRLLSVLPPLKPVATASSPRSDHSQKELGREYNPLQMLRNRKARHREQRPLDPPIEAYDNIPKVKAYIEEVEHEATDATYRASFDTSLLPTFRRNSRGQDEAPNQVTRSHKRTDTAISRTSRSDNDWTFTPAELLADAVWLLQPANRACIENRHGHRVFPQQPRSSFESARSGRRSGDSRPSISRTNTWGSTIKSDDETDRGRKKPKFLSLRHVDNSARKHLFRNRSRSSSISSATSARPSNRRKKLLGPGQAPDLDNTGPLERQMKKLIEKETLGIEEDSPEFISPDKWDRGQEQSNEKSSVPPNQAESPSLNSHKRNASSKTDEHGPLDDRPRSSFDDSTAPSSPVVANHIPSFGMSLSPPTSRQSSPERKFGLFRANKNASDDKIHRTDFAAASQASLPNSRQVSDNVDPPRSSLDSLRPPGIKRHRTTNSITNTLFNPGRRMSKDVGVGRFFKGGRIGDLVRSDSSRQSEKSRKKDQTITDVSDSGSDIEEEDENSPRKMPPVNRSNSILIGATPKQKEKERQKLHNLNLPSFKSTNHIPESDAEQDHIARQSKLHREESRSSRFDKLAPPRINLPHEDSPSVSPTRMPAYSRHSSDGGNRSDQDMLTPLRKTRRPGIFETNLPTIETHSPSPSRHSSPSKRHWSISDRHGADTPKAEVATVSSLDLARVRALYLSSGIKAHEIILRANNTASPPSDFFVTAAKTANQGIHPVCVKEEFTVAARMLHRTIKDQTTSLSKQLSSFRQNQLPGLHDRLADLRIKVDEKFTPLVHSTADEADAFTVALTTQHTLSIKQVNDAIDNVLRRRRRKLIFLQKATFTVLEWIVLALLWGVWFVVIIIRFFRGIVSGVVGGVRWLVWL
ncbi:hypothetical protein D6D21_00401 [Aureobasidium pullulans]|uniref:Uncharacterized protein n=1 Tax=Aureobasidium pullulans TaxID=5580 RepID=A0AB74JBV3_AURPU|nr:hypothetical protein D6D21_00401 [Aureobasidium pullulans]